jgi:hypothetical protein
LSPTSPRPRQAGRIRPCWRETAQRTTSERGLRGRAIQRGSHSLADPKPTRLNEKRVSGLRMVGAAGQVPISSDLSGAADAQPTRAGRVHLSGLRMTRTAGKVPVSSDFSGAADDQPTPASQTWQTACAPSAPIVANVQRLFRLRRRNAGATRRRPSGKWTNEWVRSVRRCLSAAFRSPHDGAQLRPLKRAARTCTGRIKSRSCRITPPFAPPSPLSPACPGACGRRSVHRSVRGIGRATSSVIGCG